MGKTHIHNSKVDEKKHAGAYVCQMNELPAKPLLDLSAAPAQRQLAGYPLIWSIVVQQNGKKETVNESMMFLPGSRYMADIGDGDSIVGTIDVRSGGWELLAPVKRNWEEVCFRPVILSPHPSIYGRGPLLFSCIKMLKACSNFPLNLPNKFHQIAFKNPQIFEKFPKT